MAYKVRRINFGWYPRKHGIFLNNLPASKVRFLFENGYLKFFNGNPQTFEIIFRIEDLNNHEKNLHKIYKNHYTGSFSELDEIIRDADYIDWNCAICNVEIKSNINITGVENFVCDTCKKSHNSTNEIVDGRIIDSSIKFTDRCKELLHEERLEFLRYVKNSTKKLPVDM